MRQLLISLACVALCPALFLAQDKTPALGRGGTVLPRIDSFCDSNLQNVAANCGFELGNFTNWSLSGPTDYVNVDPSAANSGANGALFGAIGGYTNLDQSLPAGSSALNYHVEFWLANLMGGSGTEVDAIWSPNGTFADGQQLLRLVDPGSFDWTLYTFGPLPTHVGIQPAIRFIFRHDPDFFFLDDLDVEPSSSDGSEVAARQASHRHPRIAPARPFAHVLFGFRSPAETFRSFVQEVTHPSQPRHH